MKLYNPFNMFKAKPKAKPKTTKPKAKPKTTKPKATKPKAGSTSKMTASERKMLNSIPPTMRLKLEKKIAAESKIKIKSKAKPKLKVKAAQDYMDRMRTMKKGGRAR
tara:strand:- start:945 stop:1265 length:321 start_codon:yes stop_codon:yes gene_type:complete